MTSEIEVSTIEIGSRMEGETHLVLGIDGRFIRGACVCIASAAQNSINGLRVHIIYGGNTLSLDVRRVLEQLVDRFYKLSIKLYMIEDFAMEFNVDSTLSSAIYYRYSIGELLFDETDRVIYVDADIVVDRNLDVLQSLDMDGKLIGAVKDCAPESGTSNEERIASYGVTRYFNSGMLLIDVAGWKTHGVFQVALELTAREEQHLSHKDQDILNIMFADQWHELDSCWNTVNFSRNPLPHVVAHYTGHTKPWMAWYDHAAALGLYNEYEALTPFAKVPKQAPKNVKEAKYYKRFLWRKRHWLSAIYWEIKYARWRCVA